MFWNENIKLDSVNTDTYTHTYYPKGSFTNIYYFMCQYPNFKFICYNTLVLLKHCFKATKSFTFGVFWLLLRLTETTDSSTHLDSADQC